MFSGGFQSLLQNIDVGCILYVFRCVNWYQSTDLPISMTTNGAEDENPIGGDRGVEALWAAVEETRQQVAQIHNILVRANLNANNRPPVNKTRAKGFAQGQPADRRRNQTPLNQPDSEDDSDEDDVGYGVA